MSEILPEISIIIPTYNHEKYIAETIQSALDQTFDHFEVVVVNDGSTDRTEEVIQRFQDKRIVYIYQENQGPSAASNRGLLAAQGKYVALLGGDDVCYPQRLELQYKFLKNTNNKIVFSWVDFIDDDSQLITGEHFAKNWFNHPGLSRGETLRRFYTQGNYLCSVAVMVEKAVMIEAGLFNLSSIQLQDFDMWLKLLKKYDLSVLTEKLVKYRIRSDGQNLSGASNNGRALFENYQIFRTLLDEWPIEVFREAFVDFLHQKDFEEGLEYELEKAFILLNCPSNQPFTRTIGAERLFYLLQDKQKLALIKAKYNLDLPGLYAITKTVGLVDNDSYQQVVNWSQTLEKEQERLTTSYHKLEKDYLILDSQYHELKSSYNDLKTGYEELKPAYEELHEWAEEAKSGQAQLEAEFTKVVKAYQALVDEYHRLDKNHQKLDINYQTLEKLHQEMESELARSLADNHAKQRTVARFEQDLRNLQATRTVRFSKFIGKALFQVRRLIKGQLFQEAIQGRIDLAQITDEGKFKLEGWAASLSGAVEDVEVILGEISLGRLEYGLPRPDVLAARPWQKLLECGFAGTFNLDLKELKCGSTPIILRVTDSFGNHIELGNLPILAKIG